MAFYAQDDVHPIPQIHIIPGVRVVGFSTSYSDQAQRDFKFLPGVTLHTARCSPRPRGPIPITTSSGRPRLAPTVLMIPSAAIRIHGPTSSFRSSFGWHCKRRRAALRPHLSRVRNICSISASCSRRSRGISVTDNRLDEFISILSLLCPAETSYPTPSLAERCNG